MAYRLSLLLRLADKSVNRIGHKALRKTSFVLQSCRTIALGILNAERARPHLQLIDFDKVSWLIPFSI
jgi:hypothetical protein